MNGEQCQEQAYHCLLIGDFAGATEWFRRAVEAEPGEPAYLYRASITLARSGKTYEALGYARRAVELAPDDSAFALHLRMLEGRQLSAKAKGCLEQSPPDAEAALPLLLEAVRLDPLAGEARLLLGEAYRRLGDYRLALETIKELIHLQPGNEEARRLLKDIRLERRLLLKQQYSHNNRMKDW
ncbi:tetratricopeptide repeat protein [Cohnella fermenti]|nr:tetratricopeptide repeat protein [Cohnella fermenti]